MLLKYLNWMLRNLTNGATQKCWELDVTLMSDDVSTTSSQGEISLSLSSLLFPRVRKLMPPFPLCPLEFLRVYSSRPSRSSLSESSGRDRIYRPPAHTSIAKLRRKIRRDEYTTCISVKRWPRRRQSLSKSSVLGWTYKEGYVALEVRLFFDDKDAMTVVARWVRIKTFLVESAQDERRSKGNA